MIIDHYLTKFNSMKNKITKHIITLALIANIAHGQFQNIETQIDFKGKYEKMIDSILKI